MGIKSLLDRHALPLIAGLAVALVEMSIQRWPLVGELLEAAGISDTMVSMAVIGLASYALSKLDLVWSNASWLVQSDSK